MMWSIAFLLFANSVMAIVSNNLLDEGGGSENPWKKFLNQRCSLEDVALLVDDTERSFKVARNFMKNVFNVTPNARRFNYYFSSFSTTGITKLKAIPRSENITESILQNDIYLKSLKSNYYGAHVANGTLAITAILDAANTLPKNSVILVFVDRSINDKGLLYDSGILIQKDIKVFVVWGGPKDSKPVDISLLVDLCKYSSGALLFSNMDSAVAPFTKENSSTILSRSNIHGSRKETFSVRNDMKGLYFKFRPSNIEGAIVVPNGYTVNIQNNEQVSRFGGCSAARSKQGLREIYLDGVTSASTHGVAGQWRIDLQGAGGEYYDVDIFALKEPMESGDCLMSGSSTNASVEDYLRSKNGERVIFEKSTEKSSNAAMEEHDKMIDVELWNATVFIKKEQPSLSNENGYSGSSHAALVNMYNQVNSEIFQMPTLLINVAQGSEMIISEGGRTAVVVFKITNNKNSALDVNLQCQGQKRILQSLKPWYLNLAPLQTATSTLTMNTRPGTYEDEITMYARTGSEIIEKKIIVDVGRVINDVTEPYMDYNFLSDCSKVIFSDCSQGTWTIEVKARDVGSGLLDVTSNPPGLYFPNGFVSGTKEEVRGVYSDSCCNADIQLSAIDRTNNRRVVSANAYRAAWSPAQISALVIGLILLIVIIIIVVVIVRKIRRKNDSLDLPRYRGDTSSRNI
ncbi:unnamed protein product [Callosobruchus maculatus]|uniref:VWFA domain-containing protein n=1 Tax=Callosobruchus maculatus TaxID=64391 RepID=A0A653BJZ6_CALMS|nr:unnamed protein product [Callosobruchus maculatus]